jgi:hypothetical protein
LDQQYKLFVELMLIATTNLSLTPCFFVRKRSAMVEETGGR